MNNKELAHLWANKSRQSGTGSHMFISGDTIYSYGSHFPIARHYKGVVLFTSQSYSSTTAKHKSYVRGACSHLTVYTVSNVMDNPGAKSIKEYKERVEFLATKAAKARNPGLHLRVLLDVVSEANGFCARFGFKTKFDMPRNLDELRERARLSAERERKAKAAKDAKFEADCAEVVAHWLAGEMVSIPWQYGKVLLRSRALDVNLAPLSEGDARTWTTVMETSKGATVPITDAEKTFRFVMAVRARGWHRNGEQHAIGSYQLDSVNEFGVIAGCHRVAWSEIERFAKVQGWA